MALRIEPITRAEADTPRRGLGVLYNGSVGTSGADFTLTAWAGQKIAVTLSAAGVAAWFEATSQSITSDAGSDAASASATNGTPLAAGRHEMTVPLSSAQTPTVVLRVAAGTGTISVHIDRA